MALDQDEDTLPEIKDDTIPDVDGIAKYVMLPLDVSLVFLISPCVILLFIARRPKNEMLSLFLEA